MKTRNRVVGRLIVLTVMLLTVVTALIGCNGKNSVNGTIDDADIEGVVTEDGASSNNISANDATNSGTSFVVTEQIDEETPESILLEDFMDTLAANYDHITNMNWGSEPTGMSVEVGNGIKKDILFANGTPIKVLSTKTNLDSYVWDTVLQFKLDNNLDQQNKGAGAVVTWQSGDKTKYVFVSNMVEIYGGACKEDLHSSVNITVDGETNWNAYPNISFIYGGCLEGDLVGDVNIKINQARPMFVVGGGHNGSVFGNISIAYDKNSWSMDVIGGGFAEANDMDRLALTYGSISVSMNTAESSSESNTLIGGGYAITSGEYTAISDVFGDVDININGQSFKEVCGGGLAVKLDESAELPVSNVFGNTSINITNSKIVKDGLLSESGLNKDGLSFVFGDSSITKERLAVDYKAQGIVDHYYKLKSEDYYGSAITNAFEAVNKADRYASFEPKRSDNVLDKAARLGFEKDEITYAIVVSYVSGKYKLSLYNYSNDSFTTKEASDSMKIYQNVKDVVGINKRYKEYQLAILEGNIQAYLDSTKDVELYTSETYDEEKAKDYTVVYPDFSPYLQWNGMEN